MNPIGLQICSLCQKPADRLLGPLLGPVGDSDHYIHRPCALWSPQVHESDNGRLHNVLVEIRRGRQLKCAHCDRRGATVGCRVFKCPCTYHVLCGQQAGCTFFANHLIACPSHAKRYKKDPVHPAPLGETVPLEPQHPEEAPGSVPAKHVSFQQPVINNKRSTGASRKRRRLEEAENRAAQADDILKRAQQYRRVKDAESSDDEEYFRKKESARLARDIAKLNPITLTGNGDAVQNIYIKPAHKVKGIIPPPEVVSSHDSAVVSSIANVDFSHLGGMDPVVKQLTEMVLLPLLYPETFSAMGITPPRGILFHGPPGTGKTLAARALAGACAKRSPVPITFFARKGADCLGKFSGEAERTLRLLFQEAAARAPAIIFLDELDALVPPRATRSGGADQIYASVVSTLLALMDGISDRGNVVVIAATNRPDSIDPGLRRPGRFDREVFFGLPSEGQRREILKVHTNRWPIVPSLETLQKAANATEGFAGADLRALCASVVLNAVRRQASSLLDAIDDVNDTPTQQQQQQPEARKALQDVVICDSDWDVALANAPAPCSQRDGIAALTAEYAEPLPYYLAPFLSDAVGDVLKGLGVSGTSGLPGVVRHAVEVAAADVSTKEADGGGDDVLIDTLVELGAVSSLKTNNGSIEKGEDAGTATVSKGVGTPDIVENGKSSSEAIVPTNPGNDNNNSASNGSIKGVTQPPCRLLLSGHGELGQERASGVILRLLRDCPTTVISLPTLITHGGESLTAGCASIVNEALRRCSKDVPCVLYLPRVEGWAFNCVEIDLHEDDDDEQQEQGDGVEKQPQQKTPARSLKREIPTATTGGESGVKSAVPISPFSGLVPLEKRGNATPAASAFGSKFPELLTSSLKQRQHDDEDIKMTSNEDEEGDLQRVEVMTCSETWAVFESLLRQAAPGNQKVIVLATCHEDVETLPENFVTFFDNNTSSSSSSISTSSVVKMAPPNHHQAEKAVERATAEAVARVAGFASGEFLRELQQKTRIHHMEDVSQVEVLNTEQPASPVVLGEGGDGVVQQEPQSTTVLPGKPTKSGELSRALSLYGQVSYLISALGQWMLQDGRCDLAITRVAPLHHRSLMKRNNSVFSSIFGSRKTISLAEVAHSAVSGGFRALDEFQSAVREVAQAIIDEERDWLQVDDNGNNNKGKVQKKSTTRYGPPIHSVAAASAAALLDEIDARCSAAWRQLNLDDPEIQRLLALAADHVDHLLQQYIANQQQQQQDRRRRQEEEERRKAEAVDRDGDQDMNQAEEEPQHDAVGNDDNIVEDEQQQTHQKNDAPADAEAIVSVVAVNNRDAKVVEDMAVDVEGVAPEINPDGPGGLTEEKQVAVVEVMPVEPAAAVVEQAEAEQARILLEQRQEKQLKLQADQRHAANTLKTLITKACSPAVAKALKELVRSEVVDNKPVTLSELEQVVQRVVMKANTGIKGGIKGLESGIASVEMEELTTGGLVEKVAEELSHAIKAELLC